MREVYAIQHNATKRIYIGSARRADHRLNQHLNLLRRGQHKNKLMQEDYDAFGEDYSFYKLDEIPTESDKWREYHWMAVFNTYDQEKGYNTKDCTMSRLRLSQFRKIEPYKSQRPAKQSEMDAFSFVAGYLGVTVDELLKLK